MRLNVENWKLHELLTLSDRNWAKSRSDMNVFHGLQKLNMLVQMMQIRWYIHIVQHVIWYINESRNTSLVYFHNATEISYTISYFRSFLFIMIIKRKTHMLWHGKLNIKKANADKSCQDIIIVWAPEIWRSLSK